MPRYRWDRTTLLVLSVVLSLVLAEIVCRQMLPPPGFVPRRSDDIPGLWVEHPTRGYTYAPQFTGTIAREDFSIASVDASGRSGMGRCPLPNGSPMVS